MAEENEEQPKRKLFVSLNLGKSYILAKYIRGIDFDEIEDQRGDTVYRILIDRTSDIKKIEYQDEKERTIDFEQLKNILEEYGFEFI